MQGGSHVQPICQKCQAPISQAGGRCPFCGAEVVVPKRDTASRASIHPNSSRTPQLKTDRSPPRRKTSSGARFTIALLIAVLAPIVLLAAIVAVVLALRDEDDAQQILITPTASSATQPPPLVILGISLPDGPLVDPTDVLHISRERVAVGKDLVDVRLLGISARGAKDGRVNLDDQSTSLSYQFLVIRRDTRASKADERRGERVELTLQRVAPQTTRMEVPASTRTTPDPSCVWSAAWSAAIASGIPATETMDVVYGLDAQSVRGVWTFTTHSTPKKTRIIDGQSCAIKTVRQ